MNWIGDCKDCKHWSESSRAYDLIRGENNPWGFCEVSRYASKGGFNANGTASDDTGLETWVETAGTFGCKLWEPIKGVEE